MSKITVILVNYNCLKFVDNCIKSIYEQDYENIEIVVVDNLSADGSVEYIEKKYTDVIIIREEYNKGFGAACNDGMNYALNNETDFVLLLNFDTVLENIAISELVKYANESTVTTAYIYNDKNYNAWYSGGNLDYSTLLVNQNLYEMDEVRTPKEVNFVSGCCMLIHKEIINKVGFFDERFFMYYEDVDYCIRLSANKIKMLYIPSAKLFHWEGGSQILRLNRMAQYYSVRNRLLVAEDHNKYLNIDGMDIYRQIWKERNFFNQEQYKKENVVGYEKKGLNDYLHQKYGNGSEFIFDFMGGFDVVEKDEINTWICAIKEKSYIQICNYSDRRYRVWVHGRFDLPPLLQDSNIVIRIEGKNQVKNVALPFEFDEVMIFEPGERVIISVDASRYSGGLGKDKRQIFYRLFNFDAEVLEDRNVITINTIGYDCKEQDEYNSWRCAIDDSAILFIENNSSIDIQADVSATIDCAPMVKNSFVDITWNGELLGENVEIPCLFRKKLQFNSKYNNELVIVNKGKKGHGLGADHRNISYRVFNFSINVRNCFNNICIEE